MITANNSKLISVMKSIAVVSVISAHCAAITDTTNDSFVHSSIALNTFGTIGVGVFMFISGYLMQNTKKRGGEFGGRCQREVGGAFPEFLGKGVPGPAPSFFF